MSVGPPVNLEAEESALGAMMVRSSVLSAALAEHPLTTEAFYRDRHRAIFEAIKALHDRGEPIEWLTVSAELDRRGRLEEVGGKDIVESLAVRVPSPGSGPHYVGIVVAMYEMRRLDAAAKTIQQSVAERDGEPAEIAAQARQLLDDSTPRTRQRLEGEQLEDIAYTLAEGDPRPVFPWPLPRLNFLSGQGNEAVGGFRPGQLIAVGAGTNFGKTAFIHQCLDSVAKAGGRGALYHNEMDAEEHLARVIQRHAGVPVPELLSGRLSDHNRKKLAQILNNGGLRRWPIVPIHGQSVADVCAEIRLADDDVVAVDILHNFVLKEEGMSTADQLSKAVAMFYETARQSQTAILLAAHLNRNTVIGGRRNRPTRYDFRGTGDIENKADVILMIDREVDPESNEVYTEGDRTAVFIEKDRSGGWAGGYWGPEHPIRFDEKQIRFLPVDKHFGEPAPAARIEGLPE